MSNNILFQLVCLFLVNFFLGQGQNNELMETYLKCRDTLGKPNWLCDPENKIYHQTADQINDLLWRLQTDVPCYCTYANDCYRYSDTRIQSGVVGAMIVTSRLQDNFEQTAQRIYNDAKLSTTNCSNGLLVVYAMDSKNLYTYRGELTEQTLDSARAVEIMKDAMKSLESQDYRYALPELLRKYISFLKGQTFDRQRTWEAMVGMVVAVVICGFAAAAALAIFFAYCCFKKRKTPVISQISTVQSMGYPQTKKDLIQRMKENRKNLLTTASGKKIPTKRLLAAQKLAIESSKSQNGKASLLPATEEPYYVISEPSTMYSTLPRDSPYPMTSPTPALTTYPESTVSQAYLEPSVSPPPEHEVQRRDLFVSDEDEKKSVTSNKK